jgi:hypothetical protein
MHVDLNTRQRLLRPIERRFLHQTFTDGETVAVRAHGSRTISNASAASQPAYAPSSRAAAMTASAERVCSHGRISVAPGWVFQVHLAGAGRRRTFPTSRTPVDADVVVVGAGDAGLVAASTAPEAGARGIVLEGVPVDERAVGAPVLRGGIFGSASRVNPLGGRRRRDHVIQTRERLDEA